VIDTQIVTDLKHKDATGLQSNCQNSDHDRLKLQQQRITRKARKTAEAQLLEEQTAEIEGATRLYQQKLKELSERKKEIIEASKRPQKRQYGHLQPPLRPADYALPPQALEITTETHQEPSNSVSTHIGGLSAAYAPGFTLNFPLDELSNLYLPQESEGSYGMFIAQNNPDVDHLSPYPASQPPPARLEW
jgi:hypothetical protein